jgi:hypothetical protein
MLLAVACGVVGCGHVTEQRRQLAIENFHHYALEKAAFSLNCQKEALHVSFVPEDSPTPDALVSGCGQKATYVFVEGAGWVMESGLGKPQ